MNHALKCGSETPLESEMIPVRLASAIRQTFFRAAIGMWISMQGFGYRFKNRNVSDAVLVKGRYESVDGLIFCETGTFAEAFLVLKWLATKYRQPHNFMI
jgi:hypothetical protein